MSKHQRVFPESFTIHFYIHLYFFKCIRNQEVTRNSNSKEFRGPTFRDCVCYGKCEKLGNMHIFWLLCIIPKTGLFIRNFE